VSNVLLTRASFYTSIKLQESSEKEFTAGIANLNARIQVSDGGGEKNAEFNRHRQSSHSSAYKC
jgi:hypothetical protein